MDDTDLVLAPAPSEDGDAPGARVRDLNPHMKPRTRTDYACPHGLCGGEGFILDEETDVARPCPCRAQRIAHARSRRLRSEIPERYRDVAFDRNPVPDLLDSLGHDTASMLRRYCDRIERTTLAMLISIAAIRARRAVAVYTAPQLLAHIYAAAKSGQPGDYNDLLRRMEAVDLLHLEDLAAPSPNEWALEIFYTVVNDRYQQNRSIIFTADVEQPPQLARYVGKRTYSRLMEMCGDPIPMFGVDHRIPRF
jgi:DNA replication protein DnaC